MKHSRRFLLLALLAVTVALWLWLRWLGESYDRPYCLVEDGLYIGSAVDRPPPGTSAVVNLCGREDAYQVEASLWAPVFEGSDEPTVEWLGRAVDFIGTQRRAGRVVYVHCLAGMNRSATVVAAYLMSEHAWSRDEALAYLRSKRPVIQPNPMLLRLLDEWEQTLSDDM